MSDVEDRFEQRLLDSIEISRGMGYTPTAFIGMLDRHGGVRTAKRLIADGNIQSGIKKLRDLGRLDIAMEQIMLDPEFATLFTPEELAAARWRLEQLV